ncbi:MAG: hypothetical protein AAF652_17255, partial [Cyanobacteria bacterium P01_C01_bin.72]
RELIKPRPYSKLEFQGNPFSLSPFPFNLTTDKLKLMVSKWMGFSTIHDKKKSLAIPRLFTGNSLLKLGWTFDLTKTRLQIVN